MEAGSRCWAVVPARHGSRRLPGKVLAEIGGATMLERVWRRTMAAGFDRVLIATDDDRVEAAAVRFGAEVARTGPAPSGTHRVAAAVGAAAVSVVNVQADQPFVDPAHLRAVRDELRTGAAVVTLAAPYTGDPADPARVKVTVDEGGRALGFTRHPIGGAWLHLGVYGFGAGWVGRCAALPPSARSAGEDLEQLAWLDAGIGIRVVLVGRSWPSVDTEADLARARDTALADPGLLDSPTTWPQGG